MDIFTLIVLRKRSANSSTWNYINWPQFHWIVWSNEPFLLSTCSKTHKIHSKFAYKLHLQQDFFLFSPMKHSDSPWCLRPRYCVCSFAYFSLTRLWHRRWVSPAGMQDICHSDGARKDYILRNVPTVNDLHVVQLLKNAGRDLLSACAWTSMRITSPHGEKQIFGELRWVF